MHLYYLRLNAICVKKILNNSGLKYIAYFSVKQKSIWLFRAGMVIARTLILLFHYAWAQSQS